MCVGVCKGSAAFSKYSSDHHKLASSIGCHMVSELRVISKAFYKAFEGSLKALKAIYRPYPS